MREVYPQALETDKICFNYTFIVTILMVAYQSRLLVFLPFPFLWTWLISFWQECYHLKWVTSKILGSYISLKSILFGEIPASFGNCISLVECLHWEDNSFEEAIPPSLMTLRGLKEIDLSHNNMSRQILEFLSKFFSLNHLNLSQNDLKGKVPIEGIFSSISAISIFGNDELSGGVLGTTSTKMLKK